MSMTDMRTGYSGTAKTLHWLILALLIAQFTFAWTMPHIGRNTPVTQLISLHFTFGIIILAVALVRLGYRLSHGAPPQDVTVPLWQNLLAQTVHWLLYALLFIVPLLGWMDASRRGMPVVMFGLELPKLLETQAPGWNWTGNVHGLLATWVMLSLVGLHVAAALYHYVIRRDAVLQRMLPGVR